VNIYPREVQAVAPRKPSEEKAKAIRVVAERLFTRRRFHEITLDEVARQAGVGKGTIYRYFRNKEDLFFQVALCGYDELCENIRGLTPGPGGFRDHLLAACSTISAFYQRRRQLFRLMQSEDGRMAWQRDGLRQTWTERRGRLVAAMTEVLALGHAEGRIMSKLPLDVLATFLLGMMRTRARDFALQDAERPDLTVVVDLFLDGVCRPGPAGKG